MPTSFEFLFSFRKIATFTPDQTDRTLECKKATQARCKGLSFSGKINAPAPRTKSPERYNGVAKRSVCVDVDYIYGHPSLRGSSSVLLIYAHPWSASIKSQNRGLIENRHLTFIITMFW